MPESPKPSARQSVQVTPEGGPPTIRYLYEVDETLPKGYGYILYVKRDGTEPTWGEITHANLPKAKWVGKDFTGTWAPGKVVIGGRKRSTRRGRKTRNGLSRRASRRV